MQGPNRLYVSLLVAALLVGCGDKKDETAADGKSASQVAAKVNGTELTVHQVNFALQRIPNLNPEQSKAASLQVVRSLVDQELLAQKALEDKLDRDPMVLQALDATRRQILAEAYMSRKLGTPPEPSDAEVAEYFNQHPELFSKRKIYRLQEVNVKAPQDRHDAIRAQLSASNNLNDFVNWLKSQNLEAKVGQGVKPAEQLPMQMLPRLSQMPDGQAMVVNAPDGLLVVLLADSQLQPVTQEQAKPAIVRLLQAQARQKAGKAELDSIKAGARIEYVGEFADAGKETDAAAVAAPVSAVEDTHDADAISRGVSGLK
jgi:EpsD family peptidyl-prolyl cis-trans isomerase